MEFSELELDNRLLKVVEEQGFLEQMLAFESKNKKTQEQMKRIRSEIHEYIKRRNPL